MSTLPLFLALQAATPLVDGRFDDWPVGPDEAVAHAVDPAGDGAGAFDVTEVRARAVGTALFAAWTSGAEVNVQAGEPDDGTVRLVVGLPGGRTLSVDCRERRAFLDGDFERVVPWSRIDYASLPTYAAPRYETRIELGAFAEPGASVTLDFDGSDELDGGPLELTLGAPGAAPGARSGELPDPHAGADLVVLSYNTYRGGLADAERGDAVGRIVGAFAPDVVCLQEEYETPLSELAERFAALDPAEQPRPWSVHRNRDCVIATPHPLLPLPAREPEDRFAAAVVAPESGQPVLVVSVHTSCCGYVGSPRDEQRILEMRRLAEVVRNLREGRLGDGLEPYARVPAVVAGDWNLVGSRAPLDVLTGPRGPRLSALALSRFGAGDALTWREPDGLGFMPGRLDLVAYDADRLRATAGFVLDTARLSAEALRARGLRAADSEASDHLALIAGFSFR